MWFMIPVFFIAELIPRSLTTWALISIFTYAAPAGVFLWRLSTALSGGPSLSAYWRIVLAHAISVVCVVAFLHYLTLVPYRPGFGWFLGFTLLLALVYGAMHRDGRSMIAVLILHCTGAPEPLLSAFNEVWFEVACGHVVLIVVEFLSLFVYLMASTD